jgi:hypothetical protein
MGPHRKLGIYVGYETPTIIKYLEPMTGDLHTARYANCVFDEDHFPALGGERHPEECREIEWNATVTQSLDPHTSESELEVQRIIHLQGLANELSDAFTDHKRVTRSHIPAVNAPERVQVPQEATNSIVSPNPRKRGDLRVLRTRSRRDVRSGKDLSPLPHLRIQLKKFNLKLKMPQKWQLNLKLRKSLKDSILKMETPIRRAKNIAWGNRNTPTQSSWEIIMSGWTIMRRLPPIMWNQESHIVERPLLSTYILPQKLLTHWSGSRTKVHD